MPDLCARLRTMREAGAPVKNLPYFRAHMVDFAVKGLIRHDRETRKARKDAMPHERGL